MAIVFANVQYERESDECCSMYDATRNFAVVPVSWRVASPKFFVKLVEQPEDYAEDQDLFEIGLCLGVCM